MILMIDCVVLVMLLVSPNMLSFVILSVMSSPCFRTAVVHWCSRFPSYAWLLIDFLLLYSGSCLSLMVLLCGWRSLLVH